jgi:hypothetical protein
MSMDDRQKTDNTGRKPYVELPDEKVKNSNPRASENIQVSTDQHKKQNPEQARAVGTEITDGEDG